MTRFYIQNVNTGRYFLLPGHGDTSRKEDAHIYTMADVASPRFPHLARGLGRGTTHKVPVYVQEPALADQQEAPDA